MEFGAVFPQTESGDDPIAIRDYAQAVESMGFRYLLAYDHVIGADTASRPDWRGPYTSASTFHEVFILFSYLAGLTTSLQFFPGILILPQRQTILVAKQAASLDVLSGGRLRLGIGIGWNDVEYEALNEDFHTRGVRSAEQIQVLKALFTQPVVTFHGRWHHISEAGIKPLPVQRPIPIWIGGSAEPVLRRVGALGDGWLAENAPDDNMQATIERIRGYAVAAGRKPENIGIEARFSLSRIPEAQWESFLENWRKLGAEKMSINTMGLSLPSLQAHIDKLRTIKERFGF